jgi:Mycothiol maleylpyruvate isomerase N-terminal domain
VSSVVGVDPFNVERINRVPRARRPYRRGVIREQFLAGARVVVDAVASPAVGSAWDEPSVLDDQTVGGLAGHLARGAVWVVGDYLDQPPPAPTFPSAEHYFATLMTWSDAASNQAIRDRGRAIAAAGQSAVVADARARLAALEARLPGEPADRVTVVAGGAMRLDDYLATRIVEQVVHLDDLARSVAVGPWPSPDANVRLAVTVGAATGLLRFGGPAMVRALFRDDASALPVL